LFKYLKLTADIYLCAVLNTHLLSTPENGSGWSGGGEGCRWIGNDAGMLKLM